MPFAKRGWFLAVAFAAITCFAVFELPFLVPPRPVMGVSAANLAGFNNKLCVLAAEVSSLCVLVFSFRTPLGTAASSQTERQLSFRTTATYTILCCSFTILLGAIVLQSSAIYPSDLDYFSQQISAHHVYGKSLYSEVEFGYGPLMFYLPLYVRALLSLFHLSIRSSIVVTIVLAQIAGLGFLAYILNRLRMTYACRWIAFVLLGLHSVQLNLCLNYQWTRFLLPATCLVFASRRGNRATIVICFGIGQLLTLAMSPELGFSFLVGSLAFALYRFSTTADQVYLWTALATITGVVGFLGVSFATGGGYLRTLLLFSRGLLGFVVEPVPYILVFLVALIWLVPCMLGRELWSRSPDSSVLFGLYFTALGLLPVAFGRADPTHVLMNGVVIYLLSFVALGSLKKWQRNTWISLATCIILFTFLLNSRVYDEQLLNTLPGLSDRPNLQNAAYVIARIIKPSVTREFAFQRNPPASLDMAELKRFVGNEKVIAPIPRSRIVDAQLQQAGLYVPTFYYGFDNLLDSGSELRELAEFNHEEWALLPADLVLEVQERPDRHAPIGPQFSYQMRHAPYFVGRMFMENLRARWAKVAEFQGGYALYRRNID